jgi:hypothetical protein
LHIRFGFSSCSPKQVRSELNRLHKAELRRAEQAAAAELAETIKAAENSIQSSFPNFNSRFSSNSI